MTTNIKLDPERRWRSSAVLGSGSKPGSAPGDGQLADVGRDWWHLTPER